MTLRTQIRRYIVPFAAIFGLLVIAAAVGGIVLDNQRLRWPWDDVYSVEVELPTGQALTPGQGQTVTVAGVQVGEIGNVELRNGRAVVRLDIERRELGAVHADAKVLVRPKTGLQDMTIDMDPGTSRAPVLGEDDVLPVDRATPSVNVDEVLAGLDTDVRGYVKGLLQGFGDGLRGDRALNLRSLLRTSQPALARTKELTQAIAARRVELRRLVSGLADVSDRLADQGGDLTKLVEQGNTTFAALGSQDAALRSALSKLPGTLDEANAALATARPLARELRPALQRLTPTAEKLRGALDDLRPLARTGTPALGQLRGLSREAQPLAGNLQTALTNLQPLTPDLNRAFSVLRYVTNELVHNPEGKEEGYLFWLAWFAHNVNSMTSTQDANGGGWRGQLVFSCSNVQVGQLLLPLLAPAAQAGICPK
ncbi:MCE family protein [Conexibacter sp. SYSU D00693]|uniref:MCE family protein n=1 Tax=Conexibacter sp. SYSU D00693 TaxID=2812560 RepID=UPI00196A5E6E|nr:MCE family protein [Conexibacter sp. SYSU D00693]